MCSNLYGSQTNLLLSSLNVTNRVMQVFAQKQCQPHELTNRGGQKFIIVIKTFMHMSNNFKNGIKRLCTLLHPSNHMLLLLKCLKLLHQILTVLKVEINLKCS